MSFDAIISVFNALTSKEAALKKLCSEVLMLLDNGLIFSLPVSVFSALSETFFAVHDRGHALRYDHEY